MNKSPFDRGSVFAQLSQSRTDEEIAVRLRVFRHRGRLANDPQFKREILFDFDDKTYEELERYELEFLRECLAIGDYRSEFLVSLRERMEDGSGYNATEFSQTTFPRYKEELLRLKKYDAGKYDSVVATVYEEMSKAIARELSGVDRVASKITRGEIRKIAELYLGDWEFVRYLQGESNLLWAKERRTGGVTFFIIRFAKKDMLGYPVHANLPGFSYGRRGRLPSFSSSIGLATNMAALSREIANNNQDLVLWDTEAFVRLSRYPFWSAYSTPQSREELSLCVKAHCEMLSMAIDVFSGVNLCQVA